MTMEIITKSRAKFLGLKYYFTGKSCKYGHIELRNLSSGNCRECMRVNGRKWYDKNKEYKLRKSSEVYDKNKDSILLRTNKYRLNNLDKYRSWAKEWRENNSAKELEIHLKYRKNNPDKVSTWNRNARSKRFGIEGVHSESDIENRLRWQGGRCAVCRCDISNGYEVDHYYPISRGGSNWPKNLQLTCRTCNRRKHGRDPIEFYRSQGFLL